jgi:hypothetical protein
MTHLDSNLVIPSQVQPSPVEMEHVSTTPDIAKTVNLRKPITLGMYFVAVLLFEE